MVMTEEKKPISNDYWAGVLSVFVAPIMIFIITAPILLLEGFFFSTLWNWWIAPTFNVIRLSFVQAIGVSIVIDYFKDHSKRSQKKSIWKALFNELISCLLLLTAAWILLLFK